MKSLGKWYAIQTKNGRLWAANTWPERQVILYPKAWQADRDNTGYGPKRAKILPVEVIPWRGRRKK